MDDAFRAAARERISRLLDKWRLVEGSIKEAELISSEAQIPAINELRYASRQLFNAILLLDKPNPSADEQETISRRITVAEQYLLNSEHDIADSVVTFFQGVISDVEGRYGRNIITSHFAEFSLFRGHVKKCKELITETRGNYELRAQNYKLIRENHVPHLLKMHDALIDAQVSAEEEKLRTERAIKLAEGRAPLAFYIHLVSIPLALAGIALAVFLWYTTPEKYCELYKEVRVLNLICR
jgi:hypothetical protein